MKAWFGWKAAMTVDPYIGYSRRHIHKHRETANRLGVIFVDAFVYTSKPYTSLKWLASLSKEAFFSPSSLEIPIVDLFM